MRIIAGSAGSRKIEAPEGRDTRPTLDRVRENIFNMIQFRLSGKNVLDLFTGSGAMSLESISRGAESATMVDHSKKAYDVACRNTKSLHFEKQCRILLMDYMKAIRLLESESARFDLVFLDPPYEFSEHYELLSQLDGLIRNEGIVVLEHAAGTEISYPKDRYSVDSRRNWGYCGITLIRKTGGSD